MEPQVLDYHRSPGRNSNISTDLFLFVLGMRPTLPASIFEFHHNQIITVLIEFDYSFSRFGCKHREYWYCSFRDMHPIRCFDLNCCNLDYSFGHTSCSSSHNSNRSFNHSFDFGSNRSLHYFDFDRNLRHSTDHSTNNSSHIPSHNFSRNFNRSFMLTTNLCRNFHNYFEEQPRVAPREHHHPRRNFADSAFDPLN